jgi:hypothetical protein
MSRNICTEEDQEGKEMPLNHEADPLKLEEIMTEVTFSEAEN